MAEWEAPTTAIEVGPRGERAVARREGERAQSRSRLWRLGMLTGKGELLGEEPVHIMRRLVTMGLLLLVSEGTVLARFTVHFWVASSRVASVTFTFFAKTPAVLRRPSVSISSMSAAWLSWQPLTGSRLRRVCSLSALPDTATPSLSLGSSHRDREGVLLTIFLKGANAVA